MLFDKPLTNVQVEILKAQLDRYSKIKNNTMYNNNVLKSDKSGKLILDQGTLIHGTFFDIDILQKISEYGILACEVFGEPENDETYYCADFFRVPRTQTMKQYYDFCKEKEDLAGFKVNKIETIKLPVLLPLNVGFIINNDSRLNELLSYDPYRENLVVQDIVNQKELQDTGLYDKRERLSAILIGVPANCISGVWIGDKIRTDIRKIEQLKKLFSKSYIVINEGNIIYNPIAEKNCEVYEKDNI